MSLLRRGYPSDLTDAQWALIEALLPEPAGCPRRWAGTMVLERRFVFRSMGVPQQMSTSCYLLDLVADTPVADPANEPLPGGNIAQLHSLGLTVTSIRERVRTRMPTRDEVDALKIPGGVPVLTLTRQTYVGEKVVEVATDIVIPGDRVEFDYVIDLT